MMNRAPVIDVHTHMLTKEWWDLLKQHGKPTYEVKEVKGGPEGMEVRPMMETVPHTPEEIARLKASVASMPIYINALVSPDGKAATVVADFKQDERSPNFIALNEAMHRLPKPDHP